MKLACDEIGGRRFQPLFGREWDPEALEAELLSAGAETGETAQRRQDGQYFTLYWQDDGLWYTAGLQERALLFVSISFPAGQLAAGDVIACLGAPQDYQAWCEVYVSSQFSSLQAALVFRAQRTIAYCALHLNYVLDGPPAIEDSIPVSHLSFFGRAWATDERVLGRGKPWPGDWKGVAIDLTRHEDTPDEYDEDEAGSAGAECGVQDAGEPEAGAADGGGAANLGVDGVLELIIRAFADAPRPPDDELLHPEARDDGDIKALYGVRHWRALPEASVEYEYAALFFLGPAGFRHFLPAYMSWVLRHPESGAAVVDHTIAALTPARADLRAFSLSKFTLLDPAQRAAVLAFLQVMAPFQDTRRGLRYWRTEQRRAGRH